MTQAELPGTLYDPKSGAELADATAAGGMRLPDRVELVGERLEFHYSNFPQLPGLRWLIGWPGRELLPNLAAADSPARLRAFAAKWGRLGTCSHYPAQPLESVGARGRVFNECIACWDSERQWARAVMDGLRAATTGADPAALGQLQSLLNQASASVLIAPVALADGWQDAALQTRVAWSTVPGLRGYLVIAALSLFAQAGGSALPAFCSGCGALYTPRYRVRRDRAAYCPNCATRARWRRAAQAARARKRSAAQLARVVP